MAYDLQIHHRRSIRLKEYDYSSAGAYFITLCCNDKKYRFGVIKEGEVILNEFGTIAFKEWSVLPQRFPNMILDVFQIMPNHMHAIIILEHASVLASETAPVVAGFTAAQKEVGQLKALTISSVIGQPQGLPLQTHQPTVNSITGSYKSLVANKCLESYKRKWHRNNNIPLMGKLWQRNYYEHIIRNDKEYEKIANYIINNPIAWCNDKYFIKEEL